MKIRRYGLMLAGALVGAALCLTARRWLSPFRWLDENRIQVYVLSSCRGSQIAAREFSVEPINASIQLIPFDNYDDDLAHTLCSRVLRDVTQMRPILRLVPEKFACNWLAQDARAVYGDVGYFPVMVFHGEVLSAPRMREIFAQFDMSISPTGDTFTVTMMPRDG